MIVTQEYTYSVAFPNSAYWLWWCIVIIHIEALNSYSWLNLCSKHHFNYTNVYLCVWIDVIFFMTVCKILVSELTVKPDNCFLKYLTVQQLYLMYVKMFQQLAKLNLWRYLIKSRKKLNHLSLTCLLLNSTRNSWTLFSNYSHVKFYATVYCVFL